MRTKMLFTTLAAFGVLGTIGAAAADMDATPSIRVPNTALVIQPSSEFDDGMMCSMSTPQVVTRDTRPLMPNEEFENCVTALKAGLDFRPKMMIISPRVQRAMRNSQGSM